MENEETNDFSIDPAIVTNIIKQARNALRIIQGRVYTSTNDTASLEFFYNQFIEALKNYELYINYENKLSTLDVSNSSTLDQNRTELASLIEEAINELPRTIPSSFLNNIQKSRIDELNNKLNEISALRNKFEEDEQKRLENIAALENSLIDKSNQIDEVSKKIELSDKKFSFAEQAETNLKTAKHLAIIAVFTIIALIITLTIILNNTNDIFVIAKDIHAQSKGISTDLINKVIYIQIIKHIFTKVLILSLLIYLITFAVKNYNAFMHNYIINTHKSNSLQSARNLIDTPITNEGKDKIITLAAEAIFSNQQSGYQGPDSEIASPNVVNNIVDAIKK